MFRETPSPTFLMPLLTCMCLDCGKKPEHPNKQTPHRRQERTAHCRWQQETAQKILLRENSKSCWLYCRSEKHFKWLKKQQSRQRQQKVGAASGTFICWFSPLFALLIFSSSFLLGIFFYIKWFSYSVRQQVSYHKLRAVLSFKGSCPFWRANVDTKYRCIWIILHFQKRISCTKRKWPYKLAESGNLTSIWIGEQGR